MKKTFIRGHNNIVASILSRNVYYGISNDFHRIWIVCCQCDLVFPKNVCLGSEFLGGDINIRVIHHLTMWAFILFSIIHIYLVFFHDWLEGRGETSAMVSGYKFVRTERTKKEKELQ